MNPKQSIDKINALLNWMLKPDHTHDDDPYLQRACYMHRAYEMQEAVKTLAGIAHDNPGEKLWNKMK